MIAGGAGFRPTPILEVAFGTPIEQQFADFHQLIESFVIPNAHAARALAVELGR